MRPAAGSLCIHDESCIRPGRSPWHTIRFPPPDLRHRRLIARLHSSHHRIQSPKVGPKLCQDWVTHLGVVTTIMMMTLRHFAAPARPL